MPLLEVVSSFLLVLLAFNLISFIIMKNLKLTFLLLTLTISGYTQDVIKFKNSDNPKAEYAQIVKIIYVDD